jgi:hypothetical protein
LHLFTTCLEEVFSETGLPASCILGNLYIHHTAWDRFNTHESLGLTSPGRTAEARQQQDGSVRLPEALVPYVGKETLHPAK